MIMPTKDEDSNWAKRIFTSEDLKDMLQKARNVYSDQENLVTIMIELNVMESVDILRKWESIWDHNQENIDYFNEVLSSFMHWLEQMLDDARPNWRQDY